MFKQLLNTLRRLLRSKQSSTPATDEMIRRETARATSDLATKQGGLG